MATGSTENETQLSDNNSLFESHDLSFHDSISDIIVIEGSSSTMSCNAANENISASFHLQTKKEEEKLITPRFVKEAKTTGIVKLSGQGLHSDSKKKHVTLVNNNDVSKISNIDPKDTEEINYLVIKQAQKTGILKLNGYGFRTVPEKVWKIQQLEFSTVEDQFRFDRKKELPWWQQKPIKQLDLSSNTIAEIPEDIQELGELTTLDLHDNCLINLPDAISTLRNLLRLNLSRNKLNEVPRALFNLTELVNLNLARNDIKVITNKFPDLIMLEILNLSENQITKLPTGFGFLIRLVELNLSHNKLTDLPPDIVNLRDLKTLDISFNELQSLPPLSELRKMEFFHSNNNKLLEVPVTTGCFNLKECYLGYNYIQVLPSEFFMDLVNLKTLDVANNKIEKLPEEVSYMKKLCRLNLQNNSLQDLPCTLCLLPYLQHLSLDGNIFKSLRRDIVHCGTSRILKVLREKYEIEMAEQKNNWDGDSKPIDITDPLQKFPDRFSMRLSRTLNLADNQLTNVPDSVFEDMAKVEANSIDLYRNCLTEFPKGIEFVANYLTELNIGMNKLTEVPEFLSKCVHLRFLNLSKNYLSNLPKSYESLKKLQELDLSYNKLNNIPDCVYGMVGLEILALRDNKIVDIDVESLEKLKRLAVLDLMNNSIKRIPPSLGKLTQLRTLDLCGNCFRFPAHSILEKGTDAVLAYLRDKIPE